MPLFKKHQVTTSEGHRVIGRAQGYGSPKITVALRDPKTRKTPRYGGVPMSRWEVKRLIEALEETLEAID